MTVASGGTSPQLTPSYTTCWDELHGPVRYHICHPDQREFCAQAEAFSQMLRLPSKSDDIMYSFVHRDHFSAFTG